VCWLAAVLALAAHCGLGGLVADRVRITAKGGVNAAVKVLALVAGMVAGADSIDDIALLRHGGKGRIFARASTRRRQSPRDDESRPATSAR
jgi:hypothetical protein